MNRGAGVKACAMARTQKARMLEAQIVGSLFNLRCNLQQVKTADDPRNPVVAAYSLCIFGNIADTGVTAAGDDRETFFSAIDQRGIVKHIVRLPNSVYKPLADWRLILKTGCSRDLAQKEKTLGESHRGRSWLQPETRGKLRLFYRSADGFNITILLVHHTRKEESSDAFNMISGTTGLLGCADGALVLQKPSRLSPEATLDVTGREMADVQLKLRFNDQTRHWDFIEYGRDEPNQRDKVLEAVRTFISDCHEWHGTATELLEILSDSLEPDTKPNTLSRRLNASVSKLEQDYGVDYRTSRGHKDKIIHLADLTCVDASDSVDILEAASGP